MSKVVLLTGATGFIGRHLARALAARADVDLIAPDRATLDLGDKAGVVAALSSLRPDVVVHLAAATAGAPTMRAAPTRFFCANLEASCALAAAVERGLVGRVVLAHSAGAYPRPAILGDPGRTPYARLRPDDLWRGPPAAGAYGVARRAIGALLEAAAAVAGAEFVELVLPTVYGPGDGGDRAEPNGLRAVPAFGLRYLEAAARGAAEVVHWGSGYEVRDFLYVDDAVAAFVAAVDATLPSAATEDAKVGAVGGGDGARTKLRAHVSDGVAVRLEDVAGALAGAAGFAGQTRWRQRVEGVSHGDDAVVLAPAGLDALGWRPRVGLEFGLAAVIEDLRARRAAAGVGAGTAPV